MTRRLLDFLPALASQCAVCRSWPAQQVCSACVARFSPEEARCAACAQTLAPDLSEGQRIGPGLCASCIRQQPPVDATLVAVSYAWPWSELIARFKFGDHPGWAPFFAGLLAFSPGVQHALAGLREGDLILPVPLSAQRLQSRGFNQAWELACALARHAPAGTRTDAGLLLRIRDTRAQTELKRDARLANVKGAFAVDPLRAPLLAGRRVILVDDVMTSGASLFTAAETLRAAGAAHITAMAFARTAASQH